MDFIALRFLARLRVSEQRVKGPVGSMGDEFHPVIEAQLCQSMAFTCKNASGGLHPSIHLLFLIISAHGVAYSLQSPDAFKKIKLQSRFQGLLTCLLSNPISVAVIKRQAALLGKQSLLGFFPDIHHGIFMIKTQKETWKKHITEHLSSAT